MHVQQDLTMGGRAEHRQPRLRSTCKHRPWRGLRTALTRLLHKPPMSLFTPCRSRTPCSSSPGFILQQRQGNSDQCGCICSIARACVVRTRGCLDVSAMSTDESSATLACGTRSVLMVSADCRDLQQPQQHVRAMVVAHMDGLLHPWTDCHVEV